MTAHRGDAMRTAIVLLTLLLFAPQNGYDLFQKALVKERAEGKVEEALQMYERIIREFAGDRSLVEKAREAAVGARARLAALNTAARDSKASPAASQVWSGPEVGVGSFNAISADGKLLTYVDWVWPLFSCSRQTHRKCLTDLGRLFCRDCVLHSLHRQCRTRGWWPHRRRSRSVGYYAARSRFNETSLKRSSRVRRPMSAPFRTTGAFVQSSDNRIRRASVASVSGSITRYAAGSQR